MLPVFTLAAGPGSRQGTATVHHKRHLYVVKRGDTLWSIAARHFKNPWKWRHIHNLNKKSIRNPHWIYPGQVIDLDKLEQELHWANPGEDIVLEELLPALGLDNGPDVSSDRSAYFVVKKGDTLWGIAAMHYNDQWKWYRVWKLNKKSIKNPHWIYPGQVFTLDEPLPLEPIPTEPATVKPAITKPVTIPPPPNRPVPPPAPAAPAPARVPAPAQTPAPAPISAHVISIYSGTSQAGNHIIVIIDKGRRDGIESGQTLVLYRGDKAGDGKGASTAPVAGYGKAQVFRTFDNTSYANVTVANQPVKLLDIATKQ